MSFILMGLILLDPLETPSSRMIHILFARLSPFPRFIDIFVIRTTPSSGSINIRVIWRSPCFGIINVVIIGHSPSPGCVHILLLFPSWHTFIPLFYSPTVIPCDSFSLFYYICQLIYQCINSFFSSNTFLISFFFRWRNSVWHIYCFCAI